MKHRPRMADPPRIDEALLRAAFRAAQAQGLAGSGDGDEETFIREMVTFYNEAVAQRQMQAAMRYWLHNDEEED